MIQFDEHIFQMGWFNHQLVIQKETHLFLNDGVTTFQEFGVLKSSLGSAVAHRGFLFSHVLLGQARKKSSVGSTCMAWAQIKGAKVLWKSPKKKHNRHTYHEAQLFEASLKTVFTLVAPILRPPEMKVEKWVKDQ